MPNDAKKINDGMGNSFLLKDEAARTDLTNHKNNTSNPHGVTKAQVGLGNVDNTSDANKPISNAQATVNATIFDKANVDTSIPDTPLDTHVPSTKLVNDKFVKHNTYDGTLSVKKADYSDLANNLDSNLIMVDKTPYLYRTSGGALEIAKTNKVKKIIGGSLPIIQFAANVNNTYTFTPTAYEGVKGFYNLVDNSYGSDIPVNHKVFVSYKTSNWSANIESVAFALFNNSIVSESAGVKQVIVNVNNNTYKFIRAYTTTLDQSTVKLENVNYIDLTQTFGTTVANRLYALEQAQAGSGIAKAKEILVKDYYPYNVTDFTHVKTSGKVNTGFNQFNGVWSDGYIDPTTGNVNLSSGYSTTSFIPYIYPNIYYCKATMRNLDSVNVGWYDENKKMIKLNSSTNGVINTVFPNSSITAPSNAKYIRITITNSNISRDEFCINFHWDGERDGEYEDYQEWTYPTEDIELKGILSLNANDEWVYDGDEYNYDGTVDENFDIKDMGSLAWTYQISGVFYANIDNMFNANGANDYVQCPSYTVTNLIYNSPDRADKTIGIREGYSTKRIYVKDSAFNEMTGEQVATALSGKYFFYKKDATTQSSATPFQEQQNLSNWGTEKWVDTRDVPLPVASYTEYLPDLKAKVEVGPESPSEDGTYVMVRSDGQNAYGLLSSWLGDNGYVKPTSITGYDATKTQVLKNVEGTLTWVDEE